MIKRVWPYLLFFLVIGVIYLPMVAPSVVPQGDSGELVTTAYFLGVAHPPGYPLYILLGNLFTKLPWGEIAWRVNLMSTFFNLLTLVLIIAIIKKITGNFLVGLFTALILTFSYNFWLYSLVAEVFPLNNFLALLILYFALEKRLVLLALVFGLGLTNHQTIIFLIIPVLILLWPIKKRILVLPVVTGFLALALPYLFFYVHAKFFPPTPASWVFPDNLAGILNLFLRGDYGSLSPTSGSDPALASLADKADHVINYFRFAVDDFGIVGITLAVLGSIFGWLKYKKAMLAILSGFLLSSVVFLSYANFPYREFSGTGLEILERFYLLPNLFLVLLIGLALVAIFDWAKNIPVLRFLFGPLVAFYILLLFANHYSLTNQAGNFLAKDFARNILESAKPNSLIILQGDIPTFTVFYDRYILGIRPDIEFLTPNQVSRYNRYRYLKYVRPELNLTLPKAATPSGILELNPQVKIYSVYMLMQLSNEYISSPSGFLFEIKKREIVENFSAWKKETEAILAKYVWPTRNPDRGQTTLADLTVYYYYDRMFTAMGDFCRYYKDADCGEKYYQRALQIDPSDLVAIYGLGQVYQKDGQCDKAQEQYNLFLTLTPGSASGYIYLSDLAKSCFHDEQKANYFLDQAKNLAKLKGGSLKNL